MASSSIAPSSLSFNQERQNAAGIMDSLAFRIAKNLRVSVLMDVRSSVWMLPLMEKKLCPPDNRETTGRQHGPLQRPPNQTAQLENIS
jgi:hypothetical protein